MLINRSLQLHRIAAHLRSKLFNRVCFLQTAKLHLLNRDTVHIASAHQIPNSLCVAQQPEEAALLCQNCTREHITTGIFSNKALAIGVDIDVVGNGRRKRCARRSSNHLNPFHTDQVCTNAFGKRNAVAPLHRADWSSERFHPDSPRTC